MIRAAYNWLVYPHRIAFIRRLLPPGGGRILDVGCGNHGPRITKRYLPECEYHGVYNERWNLDAADDRCIDRLFRLDLNESGALGAVPDAAYDAVICSHLLEHLDAPRRVFDGLADKVKPGGVFYAETPAERSLRLPRAERGWMGFRGCLSFYDDDTHTGLVDLGPPAAALAEAGWSVRGPRARWMWRRVLLFPCYCVGCLLFKGFIPASVLWDVTGFAKYVVARRGRQGTLTPALSQCQQGEREENGGERGPSLPSPPEGERVG